MVWTWPLATQITSTVAFDPGDPLLNAWILWWNAQAVPFTDTWWNPPVFYPMHGALALSEHLAGVAFFTSPLLLAGGSPALAYNAALLLSCALSGFFTYLLVRKLTGSTPASICAGLAFALAPFRAGQLSHLQVLTAQWLPLQLVGLHAYLESGRRAWLALFGAAWILQGLSNGYYLLFGVPLIGTWICWFVLARREWRRAIVITGAWLVASLPLVSVLLRYHDVHRALGLERSRDEMLMFSARPQSFLNAPEMLALWPPGAGRTAEDYLFPGAAIGLVVLLAMPVAARRLRTAPDPVGNPFLFYVLAAVLMAALALGPAAPDAGAAGWLKPYEWLVWLPGFNGLRVPARFGMLMALCLAAAGGLGLAMMLPAARLRRVLVAAAVGGVIALDGWIDPLSGSRPPGRIELPQVPAAAVLELPPDESFVNIGAMLRSIGHGLPLINGHSGYIPPHYAILGQSLRRSDPSAVIELARGRSLLLIVAERNDPARDFRHLIESVPGVLRQHATSAGMVYLLPAQPHEPRPHGGEPYAFAATPLPRRHFLLDLGAVRVVRSLEVALRDRYPDLDGRIAIEASVDGVAWTTAWEDWTGGTALAGALEDPLRVPVRFTLRDVSARYLRIHPASDWLIQDLRILAP